ncbi:MAG: hypothetical protein LIP04_07305, partial [Tannerellaceae bacterium]|nr:hypothetical protein [Tannerellaceae bacterium]
QVININNNYNNNIYIKIFFNLFFLLVTRPVFLFFHSRNFKTKWYEKAVKKVGNNRAMGSPERLSLKEVTGPKISWQKTSRFLRSVQDDPDTLREFILLFYALGKEEFENKYKKLWLSIQKHLKGKIYPILWLEEKKQKKLKRLNSKKKG